MDDLEALYWVAVWSVLFNEDHKDLLSLTELKVRKLLASAEKDCAINVIFSLDLPPDASSIARRFSPVLSAWAGKMNQRTLEWERVKHELMDAGEEQYLPQFHASALQGVIDVLEVISVHWDGEIGWKSWTKCNT